MENSMEFPQKVKNGTTKYQVDPAIPLLGIYPKKDENINLEIFMHPYDRCSIIYCKGQNMETTSLFIEGWMNKENVVYLHNGILFSHKKERNLAICDNMDGMWGHYAKRNKSDRERQIPCDLTYAWNLKKLINNKLSS